MQIFLRRLFPWKIQWKGVVLEAVLFQAAYFVWVIFRPSQSPGRLFIGSIAVLVPGVTAAIFVFQFLEQYPPASRRAWRFLGYGLICWSLGNLVRAYFEGVRGAVVPAFSLADVFSYLAYPLFFLALVFYPFENRYAPSRFRFILDVTISTGVVATLVWLMLDRSGSGVKPLDLVPLVYPIADLILLMILVNMLLANRQARQTLFLWSCALFSFLVSDYIYSLLVPLNGYQAGGAESFGWTVGGLIFACGAVFMATSIRQSQPDSVTFDLGTRVQNILPLILVIVLFWFVFADWRLSGYPSWFGVWASVVLALTLVVRMGVRAGEFELYKYWQLFSSMAEPIFICDGGGKILLGNPALIRALGLQKANHVVGQYLSAIFDGQGFPADLLKRAAREECTIEVKLRWQHTPYMLSISPILYDGRKILLAGAAHDLSEQKLQQAAIQKGFTELQRLHQQLENLNAQLEQKVEERTQSIRTANLKLEEQNKLLQELDQLKSDFVSMVSHELRTPLTSLTGGLELLLLEKNRSVPDYSTIKLMKTEVGRLTRFVENILNLSATQAGQLQLDLVPLSLDDLLKKILLNFDGISPHASQIQVCLPADLPLVLANEDVMNSIFYHLLDNAIKYAPASPVVIEASCKGNRVRVQIQDRGPGIPEAKRALLFQRFQRLDVKDSQFVYGFGLGLYLSRHMLRAMQSDLVFEAPQEGGARFYFHLKVAK